MENTIIDVNAVAEDVNKITAEELKALKDIQAKSQELTFAFGQLHLRMLSLAAAQAELQANEKKLAEALNSLGTEEATITKAIEDKYGKMQLNLNDGSFTSVK